MIRVETCKRSSAQAYGELFHSAEIPLRQQSVEWADVISEVGPDEALFLVARSSDGQALGGLPLYLFKSDLGSVLTSVPQAGPLGGILLSKEAGPRRQEVYSALLDAALGIARDSGCLTMSLITHPFLSDQDFYRETPPDYTFKNFCQVIKLGSVFGPGDTLNAGGSKNNTRIRRNLAKSNEAGIEATWAEPGDFESWYALHCKRHQELGAAPLPKTLLRNIVEKLTPKNAGGLVVAKRAGRVVGGCIFVWTPSVADAFIMSSDSEFLPAGVNYALTAFAIRHFEKLGVTWFNWQSSKRDSGVYVFKEQWGSREQPYYFLTWVTNAAFDPLLKRTIADISAAFPWHYLAPFEAIQKGLRQGSFEKA